MFPWIPFWREINSNFFSTKKFLQKKPDWSKGKPGDAKVKEEAEGVEA